jgi:general secretion pathway protein G
MKRNRTQRGFTLIELMIVAAIIGVLASIAMPKFAGLIRKSKEAAIKGHLGTLRSAISIYYSDNEGTYPRASYGLTMARRYLDDIPFIRIPFHHDTGDLAGRGWLPESGVGDAVCEPCGESGYPWGYADASTHQLLVNCTHPDIGGRIWSSW